MHSTRWPEQAPEQRRGADDDVVEVQRRRPAAARRAGSPAGAWRDRRRAGWLRGSRGRSSGPGPNAAAPGSGRRSSPTIAVSTLLKSWAMPAARLPIASDFCACCSCRSSWRRSVTSRARTSSRRTPLASTKLVAVGSTIRQRPSRRRTRNSIGAYGPGPGRRGAHGVEPALGVGAVVGMDELQGRQADAFARRIAERPLGGRRHRGDGVRGIEYRDDVGDLFDDVLQ